MASSPQVERLVSLPQAGQLPPVYSPAVVVHIMVADWLISEADCATVVDWPGVVDSQTGSVGCVTSPVLSWQHSVGHGA